MATIRMREALRDAMAEEMRRDESVFVMGEDVGVFQGSFKVTEGLLDLHDQGPDPRVHADRQEHQQSHDGEPHPARDVIEPLPWPQSRVRDGGRSPAEERHVQDADGDEELAGEKHAVHVDDAARHEEDGDHQERDRDREDGGGDEAAEIGITEPGQEKAQGCRK